MDLHRKESSPTPSAIASDHDGLTAAERRQRQALEYGEEDGFVATDIIQQRIADVPIPKLPLPSSSDGNVRDPFSRPSLCLTRTF